MTRLRVPLVTAVVVSSALAIPAGQQGPAVDATVPGEVLVQYRPQAPASARSAVRNAAGADLVRAFGRLDMELLRVRGAAGVPGVLTALAASGQVVAVQPNYIRSVTAPAPPNDPMWLDGTLWGLEKIRAQQAWTSYTTGNPDVVVANIDTGVDYLHPDLASNIWVNPGEIAGNRIDDDSNGYVDDVHGIDVANDDSDPMDDHGHGTHTAGTHTAAGNNGQGVVGVTWAGKILACKMLSAQGAGSDAGAIECLNYVLALKQNGVNIRVTNNSWGAPRGAGPPPAALQAAFDAVGGAGVINVAAAGNAGANNDTSPNDPASLDSPSIVSVAASDMFDNRPSFSNYGATTVDLAAPGDWIASTYLDDGYALSSGTSMAAPHVAGAAALLASLDPSLSVSDIKAVLMASVRVLPQWSGFVASGGRLDVAAAAATVAGGGGATAVFAGLDTTTQGNWKDIYGSDGYNVIADGASYPAYAQVTPTGQSSYTWASSTSDVRALQRVASGRVAATWYSGSAFSIDVALAGDQPRTVALYCLDWDVRGRSQRVDLYDAETNVLLDTRTVSGFSGGQYLIWTLTGDVRIAVTNLGPVNAVVSGLFFGPPNSRPVVEVTSPAEGAAFTAPATIQVEATASDADGTVALVEFFANGQLIGSDTTSPYSISWNNVGADAYALTARATDDGNVTTLSLPVNITVNSPGGGATAAFVGVDATTQGNWKGVYGADGYNVIADSVSYPAYAQVTPTGQLSYTWASSSNDIRALQRAVSGRIAATWYSKSAFSIDVNLTDGQPRTLALYCLDWDARGRSQRVDIHDAVTNVLLDSQTVSGFQGGRYLVWTLSGRVRITVTNLGALNAVVSGLFFGLPTSNSAPATAISSPAEGAAFTAPATVQVAATAGDSDGTVTLVEFFANGQSIGSDTTSPYSINWSNVAAGSYALTARATDDDNATTLSAPVSIVVNSPGGGATAAFVGVDATTQGNWKGVYGSDGYNVIADSVSYPAYAQVTPTGQLSYTWASSTNDVRALQRAVSGRIAATWYHSNTFSVNVNLTDGQPHTLALYCVDWDARSRSQRVDIYDAVTNVLLDTRTLSGFRGGQYLVWTLSGHVRITVTRLGGVNAVVSGLFFAGP